jgi:hypothetical protein
MIKIKKKRIMGVMELIEVAEKEVVVEEEVIVINKLIFLTNF